MQFVMIGLILAVLTAALAAFGHWVGGALGAGLALALIAIVLGIAYRRADRFVLRLMDAYEVDETGAPDLVRLVARLAANAGLPTPRVYVIESDQPNACAVGRRGGEAAVTATTGLLDLLTPEEIAGALAHEIGHIRNGDTPAMTFAATLAGLMARPAQLALLFYGGRDPSGPRGRLETVIGWAMTPLTTLIVHAATNRRRELAADRAGAEICGRAAWLGSALRTIDDAVVRIPHDAVEANPSVAHLFLVSPLIRRGPARLLNPHPAAQQRIAALAAQTSESAGAGARTGYQVPADRPKARSRDALPAAADRAQRGGGRRRRGRWE